jgi:hypothetical protein
MSPTLAARCPTGSLCHQRRSRSAKPTPGVRWTALAVAVVALVLMLNGSQWLLHESPAGANELLVATCVLQSVSDDEAPSQVCTQTRTNER